MAHCSRCHVIDESNKFGGIGSTPSFQLILGMSDGLERFETFFERRPHPAFVKSFGTQKKSGASTYSIEF